MTRPRNRT